MLITDQGQRTCFLNLTILQEYTALVMGMPILIEPCPLKYWTFEVVWYELPMLGLKCLEISRVLWLAQWMMICFVLLIQWFNAQGETQVFTFCTQRTGHCPVWSARPVRSQGNYGSYVLRLCYLNFVSWC